MISCYWKKHGKFEWNYCIMLVWENIIDYWIIGEFFEFPAHFLKLLKTHFYVLQFPKISGEYNCVNFQNHTWIQQRQFPKSHVNTTASISKIPTWIQLRQFPKSHVNTTASISKITREYNSVNFQNHTWIQQRQFPKSHVNTTASISKIPTWIQLRQFPKFPREYNGVNFQKSHVNTTASILKNQVNTTASISQNRRWIQLQEISKKRGKFNFFKLNRILGVSVIQPAQIHRFYKFQLYSKPPISKPQAKRSSVNSSVHQKTGAVRHLFHSLLTQQTIQFPPLWFNFHFQKIAE